MYSKDHGNHTAGTDKLRGDEKQVLYVDDDPGMLNVTKAFLEREGNELTVETTTSPETVLERLSASSEQFDCIVSDYDMPELDGLELLATIREAYPAIPFILYTGKGSEEIASEAIRAGVTDYLQKGGGEQLERLVNRIQHAIERWRARMSYRELFEKVNVGLVLHDPETQAIVDANRHAADLLEHDRDDLFGRRLEEIETLEGYIVEGGTAGRSPAEVLATTVEDGKRTVVCRGRTTEGRQRRIEMDFQRIKIDDRERILASVREVGFQPGDRLDATGADPGGL